MVWSAKKPVQNTAPAALSRATISMPEAGTAMVLELPAADGQMVVDRTLRFLRLHAFKPLRSDDLKAAGNTLTQRTMRTSKMSPPSRSISPAWPTARSRASLIMRRTRPPSACDGGWRYHAGGFTWWEIHRWSAHHLRPSLAPLHVGARWSQPLVLQHRRQNLHAFGEPYQLAWGDYRGDRLGIFTFNNKADAGMWTVILLRMHMSRQRGVLARKEFGSEEVKVRPCGNLIA